jgi:hypothetical protein
MKNNNTMSRCMHKDETTADMVNAQSPHSSLPRANKNQHRCPFKLQVSHYALSTNASQLIVLQLPSYTTASLASLEGARQSKNMYAISASVGPVGRTGSSGGEDAGADELLRAK